MRRFWNRLWQRECPHAHVLIVTSVGVRRSICEDCGNVSFSIRQPMQLTTPLSEAAAERDLPQAGGF